jgi:hypothetical protein
VSILVLVEPLCAKSSKQKINEESIVVFYLAAIYHKNVPSKLHI